MKCVYPEKYSGELSNLAPLISGINSNPWEIKYCQLQCYLNRNNNCSSIDTSILETNKTLEDYEKQWKEVCYPNST